MRRWRESIQLPGVGGELGSFGRCLGDGRFICPWPRDGGGPPWDIPVDMAVSFIQYGHGSSGHLFSGRNPQIHDWALSRVGPIFRAEELMWSTGALANTNNKQKKHHLCAGGSFGEREWRMKIFLMCLASLFFKKKIPLLHFPCSQSASRKAKKTLLKEVKKNITFICLLF